MIRKPKGDLVQPSAEPNEELHWEQKEEGINLKERLMKAEVEEKNGKFHEIFKKLHINLTFIEAMAQMPNYVKFLKNLLTKKKKLEDLLTVTLNEECSDVMILLRISGRLCRRGSREKVTSRKARELLRKQYECFKYLEKESTDELICRFYHLKTKLNSYELKYPDDELVEKFLDSLPPKFDMFTTLRENPKFYEITIDDAIGKVQAHDMNLKKKESS
ncbi:hypothetical protein L1987_40523 [Smallanthus sonchifolius]|uniref:Uncharacterized protein n=1 Tax=Smallanthus sonchifolius TaxID=185202 RepID=A0ACB9GUD0_9ASTR|nr:hypothetical protein L1987_40523 [Smallanthus sonchifolius]